MTLKFLRAIVFSLLTVALAFTAAAAEVMPPAPKDHFNDYAHVVSPGVAQKLNKQLEDFEKATSSQIVVAIYPKMETDSSLDDYAYRIFQSWGVGLKEKNNGAVLFVFIADRKMRIQTGYGLEGALPDALCKQIIENELKPHFRNNDFDGGLTAGVTAMLQAARGEYKGTGRTVAQERGARNDLTDSIPVLLFWGLIILVFGFAALRPRRTRGRWISSTGGGWIGSGGGWGGGGGGGFSGGSFSGGGGSSGGGGASGSW